MNAVKRNKVKAFQKKVFNWWKKNKRELPWRKTIDPYYIMVSEIMLQQTQVSRTIEKYNEFIDKFPTIESLAEAETSEVLRYWSGLGYNRRALWLHDAAKQIVEKGFFPKTPEELVKLKGIGTYTSRSVPIFAFNENLATIDTNIRRVLVAENFAEEQTTEKELLDIASKLVPRGRSRDWHNALMDYGSIELTAAKTGISPSGKQPKYKSSTRYYRGAIVKFFTEKEKATALEIAKSCEIPIEQLNEILLSLQKDGLIKKDENNYSLP